MNHGKPVMIHHWQRKNESIGQSRIVVNLVGIDHVGFGSDFDGVGYTLPTDLKGPEGFPMVIFHLLKRGYTEEEIEKICYKNVWRVWKATEEFAKLN